MDFIVGTFRSPILYTLRFTPPSDLRILSTSQAAGGHSWLALSQDQKYLYTTVWSDPPQIAAYRVLPSHGVELINTAPVRALSGYVACNATHVFSVGGPTGEVFRIRDDGGIGELVQKLAFRKPEEMHDGEREGVAHGNFGGLRHGAHSIDLAPDGRTAYVADIGHNCIWTYRVADGNLGGAGVEPLTLATKHVSRRGGDGPRHTWPHPNGRVLYCLQEHSCMVDTFEVGDDGVTLEHKQGVKIIPQDKDPKRYWADEVRVSRIDGEKPRYLFASTRGLEADTKGYVAVFRLDEAGIIIGDALHIFETATSGGLANAVEPAPGVRQGESLEYLALTDSLDGFVFILGFDGQSVREVSRIQLQTSNGSIAQVATVVWLPP